MNKGTKEIHQNKKGKEITGHPIIVFDPNNTISVQSDTLNSYGFDLTNPDIIKYNYGIIDIEVIGFNDLSLNQLRATLKIKKKGSTSPTEIYRSQQTDLFNDGQLNYIITQSSERTKIESLKMREALYSLAEKLEQYKRDKLYSSPGNETPKTSVKSIRETKDFLKQKNLLDCLKSTMEQSGFPDGKLGLKLFILSLSRLTAKPIHTILQGSILLSHEIVKSFAKIIPEESLKEATSISKQALSYSPSPNYWNKKLLMLHQLEGALNQKDSALEEYMKHDEISRIVTEVNHVNGKYLSGEKNVLDTFSIIGYTSKDFHKVFTSSSVICLPLCNANEIKDKLNEFELKKYAGILDEAEVLNNIQLLQNIQRKLENVKIINPFIEQLNLQDFFDNDIKKLKQFLQITNLITMLHQYELNPKKKNGQIYYEVEPQHMLATLELFKELWVINYDELYFQVLGTLKVIKTALRKDNPNDNDATFTEREMQQRLKISPATLNRHVQKLTLYNKLERVFGNNRIGFTYKVVSWNECEQQSEKLEKLTNTIKNLNINS